MSRRSKVVVVIVLVLVAIQLVPIPRENPPVTAALQVPAEVRSLLEGSCYDCHSHQTVWPWYSYVAPMSWLVYSHVTEGREELNFSAWGEYDDSQRDEKLEELGEKVSEGEMPLKVYLTLHPKARLSDADRQTLVEWARTERAGISVSAKQ